MKCPNNDCGTHSITLTGRTKDGRVIATSTLLVSQGQVGWDGSLDGTYRASRSFLGQFDFNKQSDARDFLEDPELPYMRVSGGGSSFFGQPQQPEASSIQITKVDDLKKLLKKFYARYQKDLARCIWEVFSTDRDGNPSTVAQIMPRQTMRTAPISSIRLGYSSSQIGGQGSMDGGIMSIASVLSGLTLDTGRKIYAEEQFFRVYAHELGNRLSWQYTNDGKAFGTKGGIKGQAANYGVGSIHVDDDTGARLEKCIWRDVSF